MISFLGTAVLPLPGNDNVSLVKAEISKRERFQRVSWMHSSHDLIGA